jgi:hypothetical protein
MRCNRVQFLLRLRIAGSGIQLANNVKKVISAVLQHRLGRLQGYPHAFLCIQFKFFGETKVPRYDADHRVGSAANIHCLPHNARIGVEVLPPQAFREQNG